MLQDLQTTLGGEIHVDATAAKAIIGRRGTSNRIKHVHRCFLWIQQRHERKEFSLHKCGTKDNPADLGTKYLDQATIEHLCKLCGMYFEDDASSIALQA